MGEAEESIWGGDAGAPIEQHVEKPAISCKLRWGLPRTALATDQHHLRLDTAGVTANARPYFEGPCS